MELNGALSNPRVSVELSRLDVLYEDLFSRARADPREPRPAPRHAGGVLATVTRVLEKAEHPMRAREIHAAAERLAGELLRWTSVKGILAAYAEGYGARFERVRRGCYRIKKTRLSG